MMWMTYVEGILVPPMVKSTAQVSLEGIGHDSAQKRHENNCRLSLVNILTVKSFQGTLVVDDRLSSVYYFALIMTFYLHY